MNLRTGVDLIETSRVADAIERHGKRFLDRIFTELEQKECNGRIPSLAVRFAAKEAAAKALGSGIEAQHQSGLAGDVEPAGRRPDRIQAEKLRVFGPIEPRLPGLTAVARREDQVSVVLLRCSAAAPGRLADR